MKKMVSGITFVALLIGMLTLAFTIQPVRAESKTWTVNDDGSADFSKIRDAVTKVDITDASRASIECRSAAAIKSFFEGRLNTVLISAFEAGGKWDLRNEAKWDDFAYVDDDSAELVIGLDDMQPNSYSELMNIIKSNGGELVNTVSTDNRITAVVADIPHVAMSAFVSEVEITGWSRYIEPNVRFEIDFVPNDPAWPKQWGPLMIEADYAWNTTIGDPSVLVAVIDSGIDWDHPDLTANYVALGYDWVNNNPDPMDDHGHGTHCAGVIAATINNNIGIAGLAQIRIMAEKGLDQIGSGSSDDLAKAIIHATDQGADILSCSWGSYARSTVVHEALRYAYDHGVLVIGAAGNHATSVEHYPAAYDEVVAVTATDESDDPSTWRAGRGTNFGDWVEVAAPGTNIYSTVSEVHDSYFTSNYSYANGTSMACPCVAGVAALIWSQFQSMTRDQVRAQLRYTADDLGDSGFDGYYGYGRVNARRSVEQAPPDHDVLVLGWEKSQHVNLGSQLTINTTLLNMGTSDESGIRVRLLVNDSVVDSKIVGSLISGASASVSYLWVPTIEGVYNVTSFVVHVLGETATENNALSAYMTARISEVIVVPDDYETIQGAIDAAIEGDTVFVASGTYVENIWINKELTLVGENQTNTIINGGGKYDVILVDADNVRISGFTIKNSGKKLAYLYSGIFALSSNGLRISNTTTLNNLIGICIFSSNGATLRENNMTGNTYNFGVEAYSATGFIHDIDTSNKVDEKPICYWVNQRNSQFPADAGYVAAVNSSNIIVKDLNLTNNYQGALFACSTSSIIENVNTSNSYIGVDLALSCANIVLENAATDNQVGIQLQDSEGNNISRNNIAHNSMGLSLYYSPNNTISCNNVSNNDFGLFLEKSNDNTINKNKAFDNVDGYYLRRSGYSALRNNDMTCNEYNFGVTGNHLSHFIQDIDTSNTVDGKPIYYLINQTNLVIDGVTFPDVGYLGIVNSTNITVRNLKLAKNSQGLLFAYTANSTITNVTASNNFDGIYLWSSDSNTIIGNNITNNEWNGIGLYYSDGNTIADNTVIDNGIGIDTTTSHDNEINSNEASRNIIGVYLCIDSDNNIVVGNKVTGGGAPGSLAGIALTTSKSNVLRGNVVSDNRFFIGAGIYLELSSNNNAIIQNILANNVYGITFGWGREQDQNNNNTIYHNDLINNAKQVLSLNSTNTWDNGYPFGGNYWSDHNDTDLCYGPYQNETGNDGIWDHLYVIDDVNQDNYPLLTNFSYWANPIPGDLNYDKKVDMRDLASAAKAFGSYPGHSRWHPITDINKDNRVDIRDIATIARNFGKINS